jgi:hypothetical protein
MCRSGRARGVGGSSSPLSASRTDSSCGELDAIIGGEAALINIGRGAADPHLQLHIGEARSA